MHHDPRYFEEPNRFSPDRWTEEFKTRLPRFSYFPFGGGIRGCIGESFAWMGRYSCHSNLSTKSGKCEKSHVAR